MISLANFDFGFEMTVLQRFIDERFCCDHSRTYRDPVANKIRQFDIRAAANRYGPVAMRPSGPTAIRWCLSTARAL